MQIQALTVRQLNMYVKTMLEGDVRLASVTVTGEISNFKNHYSSGHLYFTLKDSDAAIRCVMFRSFASRIRFLPEDGLKVILRGRVSLYEKDGQYQFYAEEMNAAGIGDISLQFEQIKAKLEKEGLFKPENKRPLPRFPKTAAVVTSDTGAAVRDIINILGRRWPATDIIMCPVSVQGELAVPEILETLDRLYALGKAEVIIIGRGGGSTEDLWAFNSEELARKIYASPVPVISAVGHETDFTICDFVADMRAPTPSAAAELAVPDSGEIQNRIRKCRSSLFSALTAKYNYSKSKFESVCSSRYLKRAEEMLVSARSETLDRLYDRLSVNLQRYLDSSENALMGLCSRLDALSPLKVISRGYSVAQSGGKILRTVNDVDIGDNIMLKLSDGTLKCGVLDKENNIG